MKIKDLPLDEHFTSGHTACPGCGGAIAARIAMKVFGKNTCTYFPANCLLVFGGTYPYNAFTVPYLHVLFENSATFFMVRSWDAHSLWHRLPITYVITHTFCRSKPLSLPG